jgi:hypothetical protein
MRYIHVSWLHDDLDEPSELYSELDEESFEVRKVEVYRDGRVGFADSSESTGSTRLGLVPVPSLGEIADDPEFRPEEISRAEFEQMWDSARAVSRIL